MLKFLKVSASALALSAFVIAPMTTLVTADYAYAKNGNGNGGGNGNSGGKGDGDGGGKGSGKSAKSGDKGNRYGKDKAGYGRTADHGKAKGNKSLGRAIKDDFKSLSRNLKQNGLGGLFRKSEKQRSAAVARALPTKSAPVKSARPPARVARLEKGTLHPSNLGKLNGAINSSINAKLAHIANGQYMTGTGPVSLAAGLSVADAAFADLMGPENTLTAAEVKDIDAAFELRDTSELTLEEAETILADPGSFDPQQVQDAQDLADAYDLTTDEDGMDIDRPTEAQLAASEDVHMAEDALLDHYKGDFSEDETFAMDQQDDVLDAVREANPTNEQVNTALGLDESPDEYPAGEMDDVDDPVADEGSDTDDTIEEDLAAIQN